MNLKNILSLFGCAITGAAIAAPAHKTMPLLDAVTITARCDRELAAVRATKSAMEAKKGGDAFADWNRLSIQFADFAYPVYLLQNVSPDTATRDSAQACLEKLLPFETEMAKRSAFDGKMLNPQVGQRYRQTILAVGGQRQPHALVEAFLGRKPTSDAFYAEITGKRNASAN